MEDFNPRPPRGGRPQLSAVTPQEGTLQSTPPARGATTNNRYAYGNTSISIHAPREGGDHTEPDTAHIRFISIHAPREGGDVAWSEKVKDRETFQSTPPARGATMIVRRLTPLECISIHAPREGGDSIIPNQRNFINISIHAPREGGDQGSTIHYPCAKLFQSTPPARGATGTQYYKLA